MNVAAVLDDLEATLQRRHLHIIAVDGQGNECDWDDPAVIDVKFLLQRHPTICYRITALLDPVIEAHGGARWGPEYDEVVSQVRSHIIASGRRHFMADTIGKD